MNIEEAIETLKNAFKCNKKQFEELGTHILLQDDEQEAIETLLTAYEKEKGENVKLRLQDIPFIEGELKAYKDRVNELKQELEKEKEDNKRLRKCHLQYEEMTGIEDRKSVV